VGSITKPDGEGEEKRKSQGEEWGGDKKIT